MEESRAAIGKLKEMGIRCMMLTGDNELVAKWVSEEIGLDEYFAEVLPRGRRRPRRPSPGALCGCRSAR